MSPEYEKLISNEPVEEWSLDECQNLNNYLVKLDISLIQPDKYYEVERYLFWQLSLNSVEPEIIEVLDKLHKSICNQH